MASSNRAICVVVKQQPSSVTVNCGPPHRFHFASAGSDGNHRAARSYSPAIVTIDSTGHNKGSNQLKARLSIISTFLR